MTSAENDPRGRNMSTCSLPDPSYPSPVDPQSPSIHSSAVSALDDLRHSSLYPPAHAVDRTEYALGTDEDAHPVGPQRPRGPLGAAGLLLLRAISRRIRDSRSCRLVAARDRLGGGRDSQGDVKGAHKLGTKGYRKAYVHPCCFSRFGCTAFGSCWGTGARGWMPSSPGIPSPRMRRNLS